MLSTINVRIMSDTFEPGIFSNAELAWLADHIAEPPVSAFADDLPAGVNRAQVEPALNRFYALQELERHRKVAWAGTQAILDSIQNYLEWSERTAEIRRRTGGRIAQASQFHWDEAGVPFKSAIGADGPALVRTRILDDGSREGFGVRLTGEAMAALRDISDLAPWLKSDANHATTSADSARRNDIAETKTATEGTFTCSICGKTEQYQVGSQAKRMAAMGRMSRHLKLAKTDVTRHRMLYSRKFGSSRTK